MVMDRTHSPRGHSPPWMVPPLSPHYQSPHYSPLGLGLSVWFHSLQLQIQDSPTTLTSCASVPSTPMTSVPSPLQLPSNTASDSFSIKSHNHFNISYFLTPFQSALNLPIASTPLTIFPSSQYDIQWIVQRVQIQRNWSTEEGRRMRIRATLYQMSPWIQLCLKS